MGTTTREAREALWKAIISMYMHDMKKKPGKKKEKKGKKGNGMSLKLLLETVIHMLDMKKEKRENHHIQGDYQGDDAWEIGLRAGSVNDIITTAPIFRSRSSLGKTT